VATDNRIVQFYLKSLTGWNRMRQGGNHWAGWASYLSFFRVVAKLDLPQYAKWIHYERAAEHGSHRYMHARFCIVSDFPTVISRDDMCRPHSATGPSIAWRDGWEWYSWHGVNVPREWIEAPQSIDPALTLTHPNIEQRRALCEILGWSTVLATLHPRIIHTDPDPQIGELIEVDLPDSPGSRFLRVRCPTGRDFVLPVSGEARTAREANASTWELTEEEYHPQLRT